MPKLTPVELDPFADEQPDFSNVQASSRSAGGVADATLTPVDFDPFEESDGNLVTDLYTSLVTGLAEGAAVIPDIPRRAANMFTGNIGRTPFFGDLSESWTRERGGIGADLVSALSGVREALRIEKPGFQQGIESGVGEFVDTVERDGLYMPGAVVPALSGATRGAQAELQGAEGALDVVGTLARNPRLLATEGISMLGQMAPAAPAGLIGIGAQAGALQANEIEQAILQAPPEVQAALADAMAEARATVPQLAEADDQTLLRYLAETRAGEAFGLSAVINSVLPRLVPGGATIERALAGRLTPVAGSRATGALVGFGGETATEATQGGLDQVLLNLATGQDPLEDVGRAAALEAAIAGPIGAGAGALAPPRVDTQAPAPEPVQPAAEEPAPRPRYEPSAVPMSERRREELEVLASSPNPVERDLAEMLLGSDAAELARAAAGGVQTQPQQPAAPIGETRVEAEAEEGPGQEGRQAVEVRAPGRAGEAPADQQGPLTDPLAPRAPAPAPAPTGVTREQLVEQWRAAPTPDTKAQAAAAIAAFDSQEQQRATEPAPGPAEGAAATSLAAPVTSAGIPAGRPAAPTARTAALDATLQRWVPGFTGGTVEVALRDAEGGAESPAGELSRAFKAAFGVDTVVFRSNDPNVGRFNGMTRVPGAPGVAFVNETAEDPFAVVLAHEWGHDLRAKRPDLYNELVEKLRGNLQLAKYMGESLVPRLDSNELARITTDEVREEAISDTWQRLLTDRQFVEDLAREEPTLFRQVADAVVRFLDQVMAKLRDNGADATKYYRDVAAMRQAFKDTAVRYARERQAPAATPAQESLPEVASAEAPSRTRTPTQLLRNLTPAEQRKVTDKVAEKVLAQLQNLPDPTEMAAVAYAGRAKRGWYARSAQAIGSVFGPDAPRFAALLAALSPQVSVEANLRHALRIWSAWDAAGRPQDRESIVDIMGANVDGGAERGRAAVLNAWINNSVGALTYNDPSRIMLSGPKVDSFMRNLLGDVMEVTNDTWMANYAAVEQTLFKGNKLASGKDPGKGTGYLAMNALTRAAAAELTKRTGETWTPAEVQETVWSWGRVLSGLADRAGEIRTEAELLEDGELTDELIASTPDFGTLFTDPEYAAILQEAGYGEELEGLAQRPVAREAGQEPAPGREAGPFAEEAQKRHERRAAGRLQRARTQSKAAKRIESEAEAVAADEDFIPFSRKNPAAEVYGTDEGDDLAGLPQRVNIPGRGPVNFHGYKPAQDIARRYAARHGNTLPTTYAKVDEARAKRIAAAYAAAKHQPQDPETARAYAAMIDETLQQYRDMLDTGLTVEFIEGADPYAATPRLAILDVVENNHLWVFPTNSGFGSSELDVSDNPLLAPTEFTISGRTALANDIFRAVHDYFGHIANGVGFRADGEENAWREHSAMYSPLARRAMTSETRGQNSWVNYGPNGERNRTASSEDTVYADQKTTLLPAWVSTDGAGDEAPAASRAGRRRPEERAKGFSAKPRQPDAVSADAYHYSTREGLTELDPSFAGTAAAGRERRRFGMGRFGSQGGTAARLGFYVREPGRPIPEPEDVVRDAGAATLYHVRLDNLYDGINDPRGIIEDANGNADLMEEEVADAGFDGFLAPPVAGIDVPTAVVFDLPRAIPVETVEAGAVASRARPFYSALERATTEAAGAPKKGDAAAWKGWLDGAQRRGAFRQAERDWLGVDAWLDANAPVTREQLAEFVRANQVEVKDVVLAPADDAKLPDGWLVDHDPGEDPPFSVLDRNGDVQGSGETESEAIFDAGFGAEMGGTKFGSYQLPGGRNYRELLLTLPVTATSNEQLSGLREERADLLARYWTLAPGSAEQKAVDERVEALEQEIRDATSGRVAVGKDAFMSSHFDQPNILAHVRFNERTDANGNEVLFLEEIQSDWHQKGRKSGYHAPAPADVDTLPPGFIVRDNHGQVTLLRERPGMSGEFIGARTLQTWDDEAEVQRKALELYNSWVKQQRGDTVPDAPFKATDEWAMLAFKRMVRWAAEHGFDRIAWTTGEQQAARYDLSKQVKSIFVYHPLHSGERVRRVALTTNDGGTIVFDVDAAGVVGNVSNHNAGLRGKALDEVVGKGLAEKIMAVDDRHEFTGVDLKVGGEGMRAFYDSILPKAVNKWAKRFGARVGTMKITVPEERIRFEDRNKTAEERGVYPTVHAIDITPSMREAANEGLPLFSRRTPQEAQRQRTHTLGALAQAGYPQGSPTQQQPGGRFAPLAEAVDAARIKLQDKLLPVLRAQQRAGDVVRLGSTTTADAMNAYRLENLLHGRVKDRMETADQKLILPLQAQLKRLGLSVEQLEDYLYARHAAERNAQVAKVNKAMPDGGSGLTNTEAAAILAGTQAGPLSGKTLDAATIQKLQLVAAKVDAIRDQTLANMVEAEQLTQAQANQLKATYPSYVPLRGKEGDDVFPSFRGNGKGLSNKKAGIKRALGRGQGNIASNILGELVGDLQRSIVAAEKKKPAQALLRFALANPMPELFTVEPVDLEWKFSEATGEAYLGVRSSAEDAERSILVNHNGNQVRIRFEDPQLRDAVMNMGMDDMTGFVKIAGAVNRWRSAVLTRFNPGFVPVNMLRDLIFGMTALGSEKGPRTMGRAALYYGPALRAMWRDNRDQRGDASKPINQRTWDDWAREYALSGAKTGLTQVDDVRTLQHRLQIASTSLMQLAAQGRPVRLASESIIRAGKPIVDAIEAANDATENALRLAAFVDQRKRGRSIEQAAEYAKNLTINFNRKGQWGSTINAIYLFFNAAMQGTHAVQRVLRRPGAQAFVAGLAGMQYMLALAMMGDDDDDGITAWDAIPDYVKRTSLVIPLVGMTGNEADYFAIPMPYGFNVFPYMGGRLAMHQKHGRRPTDPSLVADLTKSLTEAFSPVPVAEGYAGMFGDTLGFAMSLASNEDDLGAPIAKEDPYAKSEGPKALEGRPTTARPYHVAAQLLAKLGGADLENRIPPVGFLDVAPEHLEELVGFLTGGLGNIANQGARWWEQLQAGNLERSHEVVTSLPIIKRMLGTANTARAVADRYYGERAELDRKHKVIQDRIRRGEDTFAVIDQAASDPTLTGLEAGVYKRQGKFGGPGDVKRTGTGGVQLEALEGSVTAAMKDSERAVKSVNAAIRGLRNADLTNEQAIELVGSILDDVPPELLGLPVNYDGTATAPTRVRNRAIKLLQDSRMETQQDTLRTIQGARRGR